MGNIRTVRKDCVHKVSRILTDTHNQIMFEDLQIKNMVENQRHAKSIHDAYWGLLISFTAYKPECSGGSVELANPRNLTKKCSVCGHIQSILRSRRGYRCPSLIMW